MGQGDFNINLPDGENFAPAPERVAALQALMPEGVFHLGRPGTDRAAWESLCQHEIGQRLLHEAQAAATQQPFPRITDDIYLACLRDHSPAAMNAVAPDVRARMALLPVAECLQPTGRHLDMIEADINDTLSLRSWIHPGNDDNEDTVEGRTIFNDLASLHTAAILVATDYLLGDRLQARTRATIRCEVKRRTLDPFRTRIESGKDVYWWVTVTHNWNSVCLLHTVACALALLESAADRAWYAAAAEKLIIYSEQGFTESGFYTEGVGYWAYGFGCYVALAELMRAVTGGAVDWLRKPRVERLTHFGQRMEIQQGVYPSFADCRSDVELPAWLVHWMNNRQDDTRPQRTTAVPIDPLSGHPFRSPLSGLLVLFHQLDVRHACERPHRLDLHEWFDDVQFLICRPGPDASVRLASTFKGGDNGVNHNHNDLGTFTVLMGAHELLTDPGAEVYTERTFSARRYEGDLLNSFGHPVPVVAGQLQVPGKDAHTAGIGRDIFCRVLATRFDDDEAHVELDLRGAYRVATLTKLTRAFTHRRQGAGGVAVVDEVQFSQPEMFETALITFAHWECRADGSIRIGDDDAAVLVEVSSDDGALEFQHCVIQESSTPTRLSWRFRKPLLRAVVRIQVTPLAYAPGTQTETTLN